MFQCNSCWNSLEPDVKHVVLPCLHLFCIECAQKQLEADSTCCQCGAMFSHKAVKGVNVLQDASKHALTLCGQAPEVIMQSALTAINCYIKQTELVGAARETKLQRRMELLHQQCNEKLQQVHTAYTKAKSKSAALASQLQEANSDKEELHNKYQQRSSQVKQLKEQLMTLQQRQQQQQQQQAQMVNAGPGPFGSGGGGMMGGGSGGMLGGIGGGMMGGGIHPTRSASPSASPIQGPHMVTTVQRTQLFNFAGDTSRPGSSPRMQLNTKTLPGPGNGTMMGQQQRRNSMAHASLLGNGMSDLGGGGFDMRGGSGSMQQQQQQQKRMLQGSQNGLGLQLGHNKQNSLSNMQMHLSSANLLQNSIMGSPSQF